MRSTRDELHAPDPKSKPKKSDPMDLARVPQPQVRRWKKKARPAAAAGGTLPDDVVLEILGRVADNLAVAALFRCATACKRWRDLVSDPSFLCGRSPDPSSSLLLLGFFAQHRPYRPHTVSADPLFGARSPAFVPALRSPLGPGRRSLLSFVARPGYLDDLDDAEPLVARHGLLLVRLAPPRYGAPVQDVGAGRTLVSLAVCNLIAGTCDVLPPLKCRTSSSIKSCTILTDGDSCSSHGEGQSQASPSAFSKVLVIVFNHASRNNHLCTYSSADSSWSTPPTRCVRVTDGGAVVCQGMASWLGRDRLGLYTLDVCVESGQVLVTDLPDPPEYDDPVATPLLSVAADGTLSMFLLDRYGRGLDIWALEDGEEGGSDEEDHAATDWILRKEVDLNQPEHEDSRQVMGVCMGERSSTLLVMDDAKGMYVVDVGAGTKEEVTERFRRLNRQMAVPVEMDWLAFFLSRLEGTRGKGAQYGLPSLQQPGWTMQAKKERLLFFITSLPADFQKSLALPCYVKDKINSMYNGSDVMLAITSGPIGHDYSFDISKSPSKICVSGSAWNKFLTDFNMEAGDKLMFKMTSNVEYPMQLQPMNAKCKKKDFSKIGHTFGLEEVKEFHNVVVIPRQFNFTPENIASWYRIVNNRGIGLGPLFVHKLTNTDVNEKMMRIPRKVVDALHKELTGHAILSGNSAGSVKAQYSPCTDGRMVLSVVEWGNFILKNGLAVGQNVMFLFHHYEDEFVTTRYMHISIDVI